ncbi:TraR/DksA C4-type zinc finger protein [Calidifontibacillus oryziterrae]|uniref:hypothetical protein n=1 Tax=Calidifontibacillus oryziterrae TaxID=1191699 RepID=UPI00031E45FB|nr:hypothetical protein [Calidifontibacillus oryziterrae]
MNDHYHQIKTELELTKHELEDRLDRSYFMEFGNFQSVATLYERERKYLVDREILAELEDVNRALLKMELNLYGLCEETGQQIPIEKLKVLPTLRTIKESEMIGQNSIYVRA